MKRILGLAVAGVVALALSGCTGGDTDSGQGGSSLTIDNVQSWSNTRYLSTINLMNDISSFSDICNAYSAPRYSDSWTPLSGMPIVPGGEHEWGSDRCDTWWDLKVVSCSGEESIISYYRKCGTITYFTFRNW